MSAIVDVRAREILDSRGNPTVEADVTLEAGRDLSLGQGDSIAVAWHPDACRALAPYE